MDFALGLLCGCVLNLFTMFVPEVCCASKTATLDTIHCLFATFKLVGKSCPEGESEVVDHSGWLCAFSLHFTIIACGTVVYTMDKWRQIMTLNTIG